MELAYFHSNFVVKHTIDAQLLVMNMVTQKLGAQQRLIIQGNILEVDKEIGETALEVHLPMGDHLILEAHLPMGDHPILVDLLTMEEVVFHLETNLAYFHSNFVVKHTIDAQLMVMNLVTQNLGAQLRLILQGNILEVDKEIGKTVDSSKTL